MSLFRMVNGERVELSPEEEAEVRAEWAVEEQAKALRDSEASAAQAAAQKAATDMGVFVAGMKAALAQIAKQPGAPVEVQAAAAVDISAVDSAIVLRP